MTVFPVDIQKVMELQPDGSYKCLSCGTHMTLEFARKKHSQKGVIHYSRDRVYFVFCIKCRQSTRGNLEDRPSAMTRQE
jgi:hypothetical protein